MFGLDNFIGLGKIIGLDGSGGLVIYLGWLFILLVLEFEFFLLFDWLVFCLVVLFLEFVLDELVFFFVNVI